MAKRVFLNSVLFVFGVFFLPFPAKAQDSAALIPRPKLLLPDTGLYTFPPITEVYAYEEFIGAADLLKDHPYIHFEEIKRIRSPKRIPTAGILLLKPTAGDNLAVNAYRMKVTSGTISITANNREAMLNGILTLLQLAYIQKNPKQLPGMLIEDAPRFSYRGVQLDVSRHFFPLSFLKKFIDLMALYKLNNFHWHLTDGAGWRLAIKKYPELTSKAAWRNQVLWKDWRDNGGLYTEQYTPNASGGFYTQDEARELVAYASRKGINIIPEIEFPGHSEEVLAVYPQLSCTGKSHKNTTLNVGKEETFTFMQDVLAEVIDIFPSSYIHIGGDGVKTSEWKDCVECRERMKKEGMKNPDELLGYTIKRLAAFLKSQGRTIIGWDEILNEGLPAEATIMSWRGEEAGMAAVNAGHDVIMAPSSNMYFDYYQGDPGTQPEAMGGYLPLDSVYHYEPVPLVMTEDKEKHIVGVQGNIWTEYIPTQDQVEYMAFPRILALAEVAWTEKTSKDAPDFRNRLQHHYRLLQHFNVNYYRPAFDATIKAIYDSGKQRNTIDISSEQYHPDIHYTIDGSEPTVKSPVYSEPFSLLTTATVKAALFDDTVRAGKVSELTADIHRGIGRRISYQNKWADNYAAGGDSALLDGQKGGIVYSDGHWQGFLKDMNITIDFERREELNSISMRFMQNARPGIYMPGSVSILVSDDGKNFREWQTITNNIPPTVNRLLFKTFTFDMEGKKARFLRIIASNTQKAFLFTDEVVIY